MAIRSGNPAFLPACAPLGRLEKQFVGSQVAGAGTVDGGCDWNFLVGPGYTAPNFLRIETLALVRNGVPHPIRLPMLRIQGTGSLLGQDRIVDLPVRIVDTTVRNAPWILRWITVGPRRTGGDLSPDEAASAFGDGGASGDAVTIRLEARIVSRNGRGEILPDGFLRLSAGPEDPVFGWNEHENPRSSLARTVRIGFSGPFDARREENGTFVLRTGEIRLEPGCHASLSLVHWTGAELDLAGVPAMHSESPTLPMPDPYRDPEGVVARTRKEWGDWLARSQAPASGDPRLDLAIEGMLVAIRSCRCFDGGFMACPQAYSFSYLRDSHGGLRGLTACGYMDELRDFILWVDRRVRKFGHVPNGAETGHDAILLDLGLPEENLASESTAYYVLLVRRYLERTGDLSLLKQVEESLRRAVDAQLDVALRHDGRLRFHGDETERYVPSMDGRMYGSLPDWDLRNFSLAAVAGALASARFLADYLARTGREEESKGYRDTADWIRDQVDRHFLDTASGCRHTTLRPDGTPSPFPILPHRLVPLWLGAEFPEGGERTDALSVLAHLRPDTGFLPVCPGVNGGFPGHTLGYLLYDLVEMDRPEAESVFRTLADGGLMGASGTYSEFYGPHGVENSHNLNIFSTGINLEALVRYLSARGRRSAGGARP